MHGFPCRRRIERMTIYQYFLRWYNLQNAPYHKCWLNDERYVAVIVVFTPLLGSTKLRVTLDSGYRYDLDPNTIVDVEVY